MQYLDINKEYDYAGLESFVKDLVAKNIITEKEKQAILLNLLPFGRMRKIALFPTVSILPRRFSQSIRF